MHLAIVNKATGVVENIAVPPQGPNVFFVGEGFEAIETEVAKLQLRIDTLEDEGARINAEQSDLRTEMATLSSGSKLVA